MTTELLLHISEVLHEKIIRHTSLPGGDIATAYLLRSPTLKIFLKVTQGETGWAICQAERDGLQALAATSAVHTPQILYCGKYNTTAILLLEYIPSKDMARGGDTFSPSDKDFERLGTQLAHLHQNTADQFGWNGMNFIGRLHQQNTWHSDWTSFYISQRLQPQFKMAVDAGLLDTSDVPGENRMAKVLEDLFEDVRPSLLHGDLWTGNFIISRDGTPYLIDPSVYYGHHEVDLAMSRLFGGFGKRFYEAYDEIIPPSPGAAERNDLYQLYYLLAHLSMFGLSYHGQVTRVARKLFGEVNAYR